MTWSDFFTAFLPNFASDMFAGILLGIFAGILINNWLNKREKKQEKLDEKKNELEKTKRYLQILNGEINSLMEWLPKILEKFKSTGYGTAFIIKDPYWQAIVKSGELPRLLDPDLLESLASFYDYLGIARNLLPILYQSWLVPDAIGLTAKMDTFVSGVQFGLEKAIEKGVGLPERIQKEIKEIDLELKNINL